MQASTNLAVTVIGVAAVAVIAGVAWFGVGVPEGPDAAAGTVDPDPPAPVAIAVHVSGAVVEPGVVTLPQGSRVADAIRLAGGVTRAADLAAINLAATVRDGDQVVVPGVGADAASASAGSVDLNRATAAELEALPGVGPVLAERIVAFRTEHGAFVEVEDLLDVPGIGEAKLAQMRTSISAP